MEALFPISALPVETGGRNRLWRHMIVEMIRNDPEWKNGDYQQQPHCLIRLAPLVLMMTGNPARQYANYPTRAAADKWYDRTVELAGKHADANNTLYHYDASSDYNPAPDLWSCPIGSLLDDGSSQVPAWPPARGRGHRGLHLAAVQRDGADADDRFAAVGSGGGDRAKDETAWSSGVYDYGLVVAHVSSPPHPALSPEGRGSGVR